MNKIHTLHHLKIFFIMIPFLESLKIFYAYFSHIKTKILISASCNALG